MRLLYDLSALEIFNTERRWKHWENYTEKISENDFKNPGEKSFRNSEIFISKRDEEREPFVVSMMDKFAFSVSTVRHAQNNGTSRETGGEGRSGQPSSPLPRVARRPLSTYFRYKVLIVANIRWRWFEQEGGRSGPRVRRKHLSNLISTRGNKIFELFKMLLSSKRMGQARGIILLFGKMEDIYYFVMCDWGKKYIREGNKGQERFPSRRIRWRNNSEW